MNPAREALSRAVSKAIENGAPVYEEIAPPRIEVIPHRFWEHTSGLKASLFGACPWTNAADKENWQVIERGWTWRDNRNGTIGLGRIPAKTREEAQELADKINAKYA